jgi:uroporphyrinogen III methyltransferase/synthase
VTVYLVGAGPGDPGLLTRRGEELLRAADVVVYDRLAPAELLELARPGAELVDVGKAPGQVAMTQDDINALLVARGRAGLEVVRLKGGDPFVFGRGGEEAESCVAAGVPFEVVPGITSAIAAAAYAGIPVTHRRVSTSFTVVTGHEDPTKGGSDTRWDVLAQSGGTLVILMGAGRIEEIAKALIAGGRDESTPVAAVRNGTRADQRTLRATLGTIASAGVESPSAIIVGDVAALDFSWFERRPLFGRTVVVTRAREQASELSARLTALGASVLELPSIQITPIDFELPELSQFAWVIFTSVNAVDAFFERGLLSAGLDARALAPVRIAVIGPGTAAALERYGLRADLVPERSVAESLLEALPDGAGRVLIPRAETARLVLPAGLAQKGYDVELLSVYRTEPAPADPDTMARLRNAAVDAITFTSASTVRNFRAAVPDLPDPQPAVISIGPVTTRQATDDGLRVDVEADPHTIDGLVEAVVRELGQ